MNAFTLKNFAIGVALVVGFPLLLVVAIVYLLCELGQAVCHLRGKR